MRCHCRQSCCCRRPSQHTATAVEVTLPPSCRIRRQAGRHRRRRHQAGRRHRCHCAATAALPLHTPLPCCYRRHRRALPPPLPAPAKSQADTCCKWLSSQVWEGERRRRWRRQEGSGGAMAAAAPKEGGMMYRMCPITCSDPCHLSALSNHRFYP